MPLSDQFPAVAAAAAAHRPRYPDGLDEMIAALEAGRSPAPDVATGNGQAADGPAGRFARVIVPEAARCGLGGGLGEEGTVRTVRWSIRPRVAVKG